MVSSTSELLQLLIISQFESHIYIFRCLFSTPFLVPQTEWLNPTKIYSVTAWSLKPKIKGVSKGHDPLKALGKDWFHPSLLTSGGCWHSLAMPCNIRDFSPLTRNGSHALCSGSAKSTSRWPGKSQSWCSLPIEIVGRNMDVKSDSGKGSEGNEKLRSGILCHLREYIYCHEQNFARNNEH